MEPTRRPRCTNTEDESTGDGLTDHELVERARLGDERAYGELVRRYQGLAFRAAYLITRSKTDAEDATQEGFVKAWRALGRFRAGSEFRPWVLTIVANEARNRRRSVGRQAVLTVGATTHQVPPAPDELAIASEERSRLLEAVEGLVERDRLVVAYHYFLDLSEREIADVLGIRRGTVKSRLSRARHRLASALSDILETA